MSPEEASQVSADEPLLCGGCGMQVTEQAAPLRGSPLAREEMQMSAGPRVGEDRVQPEIERARFTSSSRREQPPSALTAGDVWERLQWTANGTPARINLRDRQRAADGDNCSLDPALR